MFCPGIADEHPLLQPSQSPDRGGVEYPLSGLRFYLLRRSGREHLYFADVHLKGAVGLRKGQAPITFRLDGAGISPRKRVGASFGGCPPGFAALRVLKRPFAGIGGKSTRVEITTDQQPFLRGMSIIAALRGGLYRIRGDSLAVTGAKIYLPPGRQRARLAITSISPLRADIVVGRLP